MDLSVKKRGGENDRLSSAYQETKIHPVSISERYRNTDIFTNTDRFI